MHSNFLFALDIPGGAGSSIIAIFGIIVCTFIFMSVWASRYVKVGPNQVLIVSGRQYRQINPNGTAGTIGFRIVKGGGTFVLPVIEKVDVLSLEVLTIDTRALEVCANKGAPVKIDAVAQIKIKGDDMSIATAAEHFLGKSNDEIKGVATQTIENHLCAIVGTMIAEEANQNRGGIASRVQELAARDLAGMGLALLSFSVRDVRVGAIRTA